MADLAVDAMRCIEVEGRELLVVNVGGRVLVTDNTCTHEDASLSDGVLEGEQVRCPLHGSRFDLRTGKPLEEPATDPLRCYLTRVDNGQVLVVFEALE